MTPAAPPTHKIPRRMRAVMGDRVNAAMRDLYVPRIHFVCDFDGRVDEGRLRRAVRLAMDAEPVIGCRFVPRWIAPYWLRLDADDLDRSPYFRFDEVGEVEVDGRTHRFLIETMEDTQGAQLKAALLRGPERDRFVFKINHMVADAGGTKQLAYEIASIYRELGANASYRPPVNRGSRSLSQVYRRIPLRDYPRVVRRYFRDMRENWFPWQSLQLIGGTDRSGGKRFLFHRIGGERGMKLRAYAAERGATVNDLVVAAIFRGFARHGNWNGRDALRLVCTADLRRYLPGQRAESICNLSAFYWPALGTDLGDTFEDTLQRIARVNERLKNDFIGLGFNLGSALSFKPIPFFLWRPMLRRFFRRLHEGGNAPIGLTNLGAIDDARLDFGDARVAEAETVVPISLPPYFVFGLSGFRDTLTISTGFYEPAFRTGDVTAFLAAIDEELPA